MAVGERCPACGHMPEAEPSSDPFGGGPFTYAEPYDQTIAWAVELTKHTSNPGMTAEEVALRLATLHGALMGLTFAKQTADPPA